MHRGDGLIFRVLKQTWAKARALVLIWIKADPRREHYICTMTVYDLKTP